MKSSKMIDILKIWSKKYKVNYKIIPKRDGDKNDETLISTNEVSKTSILKYKNKIYYIIDPKSKNKREIKKTINSYNSKKLNKNEIIKILNFGF